MGAGNINDAGAARFVKVNFPDLVVGPEDLNGIDPPVSIGVYALERDYFLWFTSTDEAEYDEEYQPGRPLHTKRLPFPTGRANENVNPPEITTNFDIWTSPVDDDGELRIKANVRYVVAYE